MVTSSLPAYKYPLLLLFGMLLFVVCGVSLHSAQAQGQTPRLSLEVTPRQGSIDDVFTFSVVVEGLGTEGFPLLQGGDEFKLTLIGSQVEMVGGAHEPRFKTVYRYQLLPKKTGVLETPSAELSRGSIQLSAKPLAVTVTSSKRVAAARSEDVFVLQSLANGRVFVGQQVGLLIELFSQKSVYRPQFVDLTLDDFIVQNLSQEDPFQRNVDGKRYEVLQARKALYPLRAGSLEIPPVHMEVSVLLQRVVRLPAFGGFFNFESIEQVPEQRSLESNALTLQVDPLPARPSSYLDWGQSSPIVGVTDMRGSLDHHILRTGETATLTVNLSSTGNVLGIKELPLQSTDSYRVYPEQSSVQTREYLGQMITTKRFSVSIVPLVPGRLSLPSLALDYFDPTTRQYRRASLEPLVLNVTGKALIDPERAQRPASPQSTAPASSESATDSDSVPALRSSNALDTLWTWVSPGTLALFLAGAVALVLFGWAVMLPKPEIGYWSGTTDALVTAFLNEISNIAEVPLHGGERVPFEALRNGLRASSLDPAWVFDLCAVLDKLERHGVTDFDPEALGGADSVSPKRSEPTKPAPPDSEIHLGNLPEGLIKRMEAIVPSLRARLLK